MKRALPWSDEDDDSSSGESSDSDSKTKASQVKPGKKNSKVVAFEALKQYGYRGGPSVLGVPPPKEPETEPDWSWSTCKERKKAGANSGTKMTEEQEVEESYEQRQKTRAALAAGEQLEHAVTRNDKKTFSQKEKRKRDLGQVSRGKNYVEEEKRLLRDSGVYSGFDT